MQLIEESDWNDINVVYTFYCFLKNKILDQGEIPNCIHGLIYKLLMKSQQVEILELLNKDFCNGLLQDNNTQFHQYYIELQNLLLHDSFLEADKLTSRMLCLMANVKVRNWLYFSDISNITPKELEMLDNLWKIYSKGKFGFSIQRQIWLNNNQNWDVLWQKLGWQKNNVLCRYPEEFIWTLLAPTGHLPLSNQLRGVQTLKALFNLKIWK
nr:Ycf53 [Madagascaria erythrocladioides]